MIRRPLEWLCALAALGLTLVILLPPGEARPQDLEFHVEQTLISSDSLELVVRWRWLRQPHPWFGRTVQAIGIVHPPRRLSLAGGWTSPDVTDLIVQAGEPMPNLRVLIPTDTDGEKRYTFSRRGEPLPLPIRVQFIHAPENKPGFWRQGWVKGVDLVVPTAPRLTD